MNIQSNINKLLVGIKLKGKNVKLDTKLYYSDRAGKYITKHIFYERIKVEDRYGEEKDKWVERYSGYGKASLLKYIADYYNRIGSEADEE